MTLITDHAYDCGPNEETGGPCIADSGIGTEGLIPCGQPRDQHERTEYPDMEFLGHYSGKLWGSAGEMHEPKPYTEPLDWEAP